MNNNGVFGRDPGQATIVIQTKHDKTELKNRINKMKNKDKKEVKDNYYFYKYDAGPITDEAVTRIDRGDMVFTVGTSFQPRASSTKATAVPVVSSINGMYVRKSTKEDLSSYTEEQREKIVNQHLERALRFIGISLGWTNPTPDIPYQEKTQITTRVRGTGQLFNNGTETFVPGDTVVWKIPTSADIDKLRDKFDVRGRFGHSSRKITPVILPLRHFIKENYTDGLLGVFLADDKNSVEKLPVSTTTDFAKALKTAMLTMFLKGVKAGKDSAVTDFDDIIDKLSGGLDDVAQSIVSGEEKKTTVDSTGNDVDVSLVGVGKAINVNAFDGKLENVRDMVNTMLLPFVEIQDDIRRRTVGRAAGYSEPGTNLELIINY